PPAQPRTALILGQYLSSLELIGPDEETALHERMIAVAAERGMERVVFKPHPAAPPGMLAPLREAAGAAGVDFLVLDSPAIAEIAIAALKPELLLSCFSTALATGATMFGTPAVAVGTGRMLQALAPYGNSNRVPLSIVDRLWSVDDKPAGPPLQDLVDAIAYCMQAGHLADLEPRVRTTVATATPELLARYFKRRRLAKVGLPVPQGGRRVPDAVRVAARLGRFSAARLAEALQAGARR
ncbi:alpha-2,8-polysialyltransferase family protein, partial [Sediminivirga luteola]